MFVEVYKDRATFIENIIKSYDKTDALLENHIKRRVTRLEDDLPEENLTMKDPETTISLLLDLYDGKSMVEITNVVKGFTKKNGKQVVAVAHTKLKKNHH